MAGKTKARPVVVAVTSDLHIGSTLGLCPPEGVRLDDDGTYHPSKVQRWSWDCWEQYWARVGEVRKGLNAELRCVFNGDASDGDHHNTPQIISRNPEPAAYIADRVFGVPKALTPNHVFVVRGTEVHVGPSGATEEAWARSLKAERHPETRTWSWWHLRFAVHGVRFDFQHHGKIGTRPWTKGNPVMALALEIFYQHAARGEPYPHLAFRSHFHQHFDTGSAHPTRVIQTPAWQLKTSHAHKVAPESLPDIGGLIVVVMPDGTYTVEDKLYKPAMAPLWEAA